MTFARLPESVQTLYAELLDQIRAADTEAAVAGVTGTFVSKAIRGRTYWYEQRSEGSSKRQIYLGPESPELLARMEKAGAHKSTLQQDERRRREIVTMLEAGGMFRESAAVGIVLRVLADASVFRAGGVLVGTQAFACIANMLGVKFEHESIRTADVDVAHDSSISLGVAEPKDISLIERLRRADPGFAAVPGMDSREPSTSFKVRGRDLRVDFLTPAPKRNRALKPVYLPHIGVAQPLFGLDYLIAGNVDVAVVVGSGIRVNVPSPGRFAFHKLWVSTQRSQAEEAKARKDVRQAEQLLELLLEDRPDDLRSAWRTARKQLGSMRTAWKKIDASLRGPLQETIGGIT